MIIVVIIFRSRYDRDKYECDAVKSMYHIKVFYPTQISIVYIINLQ